MATKNNPGAYDYYQRAEVDEPMFVLLARDRLAPALVDVWTRVRVAVANTGEQTAQADEAARCMVDMRNYLLARARMPVDRESLLAVYSMEELTREMHRRGYQLKRWANRAKAHVL